MKFWKYLAFAAFLFCSAICYSQTWTERNDEGKFDYEWTVISKEQYDRLLKQNQEMHRYCGLTYTDAIEKSASLPVTSGTRPELEGQYYLYCKVVPHADIPRMDRTVLSIVKSTLVYGNSSTGEMMLNFGDSVFMVDFYQGIYLGKETSWLFDESGWDKYQKTYNQFLGYIDSE